MHVNLNAYAGERQLYSSDTDQVALNRRLDNELTVAVNWFRENGLMANPKKFQTMVLGSKKWGFCFVANKIVIDEYDNINLSVPNTSQIFVNGVNKQLQGLKVRLYKALYCPFFFIALVSELSAVIRWSC